MWLRLHIAELFSGWPRRLMMPVYLDAIPESLPSIPTPRFRRWLLLYFLLIAVSLSLMLWASPANTDYSKIYFWLTLVGWPTLLWCSLYSLRALANNLHQAGVDSWNRARRQLLQDETDRGQRCAWLLTVTAQTQAGLGVAPLRKAVAEMAPVLTPNGINVVDQQFRTPQ